MQVLKRKSTLFTSFFEYEASATAPPSATSETNPIVVVSSVEGDNVYRFDEVHWPDDMGYKGTTFFSPATYRQMVQPFHKAAVDWAHNKGIYARLHSCGNIMSLVPDIVATGMDALNPLEIKAGMDPLQLKKEYGDRLVLHGGINAVLEQIYKYARP